MDARSDFTYEGSDVVLSDIIDMSDIGVYVTDYETGELLLYNTVYENIVPQHMIRESLIGTKCYEYHGYKSFCPFCPRGKLVNKNGIFHAPVQAEVFIDKLNIWLRGTLRLLEWNDGRLAQVCTFVDITQSKQQEEHMAHIAYFDQGLDIPNGMRLFLDLLSNRRTDPFMIVFDLTGLRKINDVYGRDSGDALLESIRDWLLSVKGDIAELYRVGGDEFVLSGFGCDQDEISWLSNMIWERFRSPWHVSVSSVTHYIYIGVAMGIIPNANGIETFPDMMNMLERIMTASRRNGGILVFDDTINNEFMLQSRMEMSLRKCVYNNMQGFSVVYQPIVDPHTEIWTGVEALCRWSSPEMGNVSPVHFIPLAEQMDLIGPIDEWVLEEAVRQVKQWGLDSNERFLLDVNLSPIQLNDDALCSKVESVLKKYDYPPTQLSLEITESMEIKFNDRIVLSLERLNEMGISLSLDDFGTGYSTFSTLRNIPLKIVKTDRSFCQNIENDNLMQQTIRVMIEFAHVIGSRVVSEGVETEDQRRVLLIEGADLLQGYYYAKPLTVAEIEEQLHRFKAPLHLADNTTHETIDLSLLEHKNSGYTLTLPQYRQFSRCVRVLSHRQDTADSLHQALEAISEGMKANLSFAYILDSTLAGEHIHYYCGHDVKPDPEKINNLVEYFVSRYRENELVFANNRSMMSEKTRNAFPSVHSLLALPIKYDDVMWGIIGVCEDRLENRAWTREEIQLLYLSGGELGQSLYLKSLEHTLGSNRPKCVI